ncbi:MAG: LysM peptidoglycan-binding domain-containing protein [Lachnospiraceae bacterium]|nr:LysM peptidoglycan-binding domain-containing protein [Lachnospiraceae bacterium]
MVEIVYDKEIPTEENGFEDIPLPKNIRQIGTPCGNRRIYIEDYVMTYLNQLANPNATYARGAILVGECVRGQRGEVLFVSGAIPAQNLELDLEETSFDGETWSHIYQEVKTYFPELQVVGWFLSRMGFSTTINDIIVQLHLDNFAGEEKVLYIMDALEGEEAFYRLEGEYLRKQSGYYIYYARNEAMQNFMIESKGQLLAAEPSDVEQKDEAVLRNYKKIMEERTRQAKIEAMNRRLSHVCSALVIAVLALGVAVFSNYQMLGKMERKLAQAGIYFADEAYGEYKVFMTELPEEEKTEAEMTAGADNDALTAAPDVKKEEVQEKSDLESEKVTAMAQSDSRYYIVQRGDTLSSISFKMYNSVGYVAELMAANGFGEADEIKEGDMIVIPDVN